MKYSVIVPVYRTADYLCESIDSILNQTFNDYEILLMDDGSDDQSSEICDNLSMNDPRISVVHKKNEGLMMTRRRGFSIAAGIFIINIDSDDYLIDVDAFNKINEVITQNNCDLVFNDYIYGATLKKPERIIHYFNQNRNGIAFTSDDKIELLSSFAVEKPINNMWLKVAKKSIMDIDIDYSVWQKEICRAEDRFQSIAILDNATRVGYVAEPLYYYRWTEGSISNNPKLKNYYAFRTLYNREDEYFEKWNIDNIVYKKVYRRRLLQILGVLIDGYRKANKREQKIEWHRFMKDVGEDTFFCKLYNNNKDNDILPYYRMFSYLIIHNRIHMAAMLIDTVSFISAIKHGRK